MLSTNKILYFITTKILNGRQARWYEELSSLKFLIKHRKGELNKKADALSRRADHHQCNQKTEGKMLKYNDDGTLSLEKATDYLRPIIEILPTGEDARIKKAYEEDTVTKVILGHPEEYPEYEVTKEGFILRLGLVYIPKPL